MFAKLILHLGEDEQRIRETNYSNWTISPFTGDALTTAGPIRPLKLSSTRRFREDWRVPKRIYGRIGLIVECDIVRVQISFLKTTSVINAPLFRLSSNGLASNAGNDLPSW